MNEPTAEATRVADEIVREWSRSIDFLAQTDEHNSLVASFATLITAKDAEIEHVKSLCGPDESGKNVFEREHVLKQAVREKDAEIERLCCYHDGKCYFCGEQTKMLAGNPDQWPLRFCFGDDSGEVKAFHTSCVVDRLEQNHQQRALLVDVLMLLSSSREALCQLANLANTNLATKNMLLSLGNSFNAYLSTPAAMELLKEGKG